MKNDIENNLQKKIISFVNKNKKNNYKQYNDNNYFNTWVLNFGNYFLRKKFLNISFLNDLKLLFILFYKKNISKNYNFFFNLKNENLFKKKFLNLIISFKTNNTDFDNHFSSNRSQTKNSLWILINLSETSFFEKSENITLSKKKKYNHYFIKLKTVILFLFWFFLSNKKHEDTNIIKTLEEVINKINLHSIKKVFLPYEAQPYQKYLINLIKKKNPTCKIIAYCHGGLPSLPIEYVANNLIDKIYIHSKIERDILIKFFRWKKSKVFLTRSFRHIDNKKIKPNKIYLPYSFTFNQKLKEDLNFIFSKYNLRLIKIASHPFTKNSFSERKLLEYVKQLKYNKNLKQNKKEKVAIFLGVTGSILEALQNNFKVIHITNNPQFESYSNFLWKNINVIKISHRIFVYKLKKKNNLIMYSKKNFFIKKNKL